MKILNRGIVIVGYPIKKEQLLKAIEGFQGSVVATNTNMRTPSKDELIKFQQVEIDSFNNKNWLRKLALKYKGNEMPKDNNSRENHKRGLKKRIANYATQHTLRTMDNSPMKIALAVKQNFYRNWIKHLGLK